MLTEKDYCDYDTCVALKELGHDEKCHGYYEPQNRCFNTTSIKHSWCNSEVDDIGVIICPTLYEAQKWLREERNIDILPRRGCITNDKQRYQVVIYINYNRNQILLDDDGEDYSSPEEALSEGLRTSIKILRDE